MLRSKVTAKAQTTLPSGVRKALGIGPGDELAYIVEGNRAIIVKATDEEQDPVLGAFLDFLARDIEEHPDRLKAATPEWVERLRAITGGGPVDLDEPIVGPVAL